MNADLRMAPITSQTVNVLIKAGYKNKEEIRAAYEKHGFIRDGKLAGLAGKGLLDLQTWLLNDQPKNQNLELRDHFAGKAMEAMLINKESVNTAFEASKEFDCRFEQVIANSAYKMADAMLEAGKK